MDVAAGLVELLLFLGDLTCSRSEADLGDILLLLSSGLGFFA